MSRKRIHEEDPEERRVALRLMDSRPEMSKSGATDVSSYFAPKDAYSYGQNAIQSAKAGCHSPESYESTAMASYSTGYWQFVSEIWGATDQRGIQYPKWTEVPGVPESAQNDLPNGVANSKTSNEPGILTEPQTISKPSVIDRKLYFISNSESIFKVPIANYVASVIAWFPVDRDQNDCWIHPHPPQACWKGKPKGTINRSFSWRSLGNQQTLHVPYGVAALLAKDRMSAEEKQGYINKAWHLSHLCGNWMCCNSAHFVVEPGSINSSRNKCFRRSEPCQHHPPCIKSKKREDLTRSWLEASKVMDQLSQDSELRFETLGGVFTMQNTINSAIKSLDRNVLIDKYLKAVRLTALQKSLELLKPLAEKKEKEQSDAARLAFEQIYGK